MRQQTRSFGVRTYVPRSIVLWFHCWLVFKCFFLGRYETYARCKISILSLRTFLKQKISLEALSYLILSSNMLPGSTNSCKQFPVLSQDLLRFAMVSVIEQKRVSLKIRPVNCQLKLWRIHSRKSARSEMARIRSGKTKNTKQSSTPSWTLSFPKKISQ